MNVPVLGKTIALSDFSSIAIAVCAVVPFHEGGINRIAYRRSFYSSLNFGSTAKYNSQINSNHPAFLACFVNSGIFQALHRHAASAFGTATFACVRRRNILAVGFESRLFVRLILVRGNQIHNTTTGSFLEIPHKLCDVVFGAFAGYNAYYQTMLGIICYVIPVVSLLIVRRVIIITVFFFLAHKRPFLVKLHLVGLGGKALPIHHEELWRVHRRQGYSVLPCLDVRLQDGWSYAHHNFRRRALTERAFSSQVVEVQTTVCLFVQKIASCMSGSIAAGYGCFCRTSRILSDYLRRVFHNQGTFYSDNRILKKLALPTER